MITTDAPEMYVVRIYGPVAGQTALLEEHDFTWEVEARQLYEEYPLGDGVTLVELAATWDNSGSETRGSQDQDSPLLSVTACADPDCPVWH